MIPSPHGSLISASMCSTLRPAIRTWCVSQPGHSSTASTSTAVPPSSPGSWSSGTDGRPNRKPGFELQPTRPSPSGSMPTRSNSQLGQSHSTCSTRGTTNYWFGAWSPQATDGGRSDRLPCARTSFSGNSADAPPPRSAPLPRRRRPPPRHPHPIVQTPRANSSWAKQRSRRARCRPASTHCNLRSSWRAARGIHTYTPAHSWRWAVP